jgi:hypothetical protein
LTIEDGTDRLPRNVCNELQIYAAQSPRRTQALKVTWQNIMWHHIYLLVTVVVHRQLMHKFHGLVPCVVVLYHRPLFNTHVPIYGRYHV